MNVGEVDLFFSMFLTWGLRDMAECIVITPAFLAQSDRAPLTALNPPFVPLLPSHFGRDHRTLDDFCLGQPDRKGRILVVKQEARGRRTASSATHTLQTVDLDRNRPCHETPSFKQPPITADRRGLPCARDRLWLRLRLALSLSYPTLDSQTMCLAKKSRPKQRISGRESKEKGSTARRRMDGALPSRHPTRALHPRAGEECQFSILKKPAASFFPALGRITSYPFGLKRRIIRNDRCSAPFLALRYRRAPAVRRRCHGEVCHSGYVIAQGI